VAEPVERRAVSPATELGFGGYRGDFLPVKEGRRMSAAAA
jgi:hypothetical protein